MKKRYLLLLALFSLTIASCKNNNQVSSDNNHSTNDSTSSNSNYDENTLRTITIGNFEHGSISANKYSAYAGDEIVLTISCDNGYELLDGNLKYNNVVIKGNTFTMIDENVEIFATFTKIADKLPDTEMIIKSSVNNNEAIAYYEAKYVLAGIEFKITVIDDQIIEEGYDLTKRDSVGLLVNKTNDTKGLAKNETINFVGTSTGYYEISRATSRTSFSTSDNFDMNIAPGNNFYTSSYKTTINDKNAYVVNVYFGYDLMNTTYEEGYKNLTMCPFLTNANEDGTNCQYGQNDGNTGYGYYCFYKNAKTFALISDDNTFVKRATGTSADILNEQALPDGYILGANFTGPGWWNMTYVCLNENISLENVTAIIIQVRFNEAVSGDWFRLGATTEDGTFYDAFGKDSSTEFSYSVTEQINETANYNWKTGQWGGWDPSWNGQVPPTYYVEVPLENMFARFNIKQQTMSAQVGSSLQESNSKLSQLGVYLTANASYNLSIGNTYVRKNGKVEQITDAKNYSNIKENGLNYCYAAKLDSSIEQETTLELKVYTQNDEE